MNNHIRRPITDPIRQGLCWHDKWENSDKGIILCWERGRQKSLEDSELAKRALNNELPVLGWKGGIDKAIQKKQKYGSLNYLAQWQGLRGENLDIVLDEEKAIVCSVTNMTVIFTADQEKYKNA